MVFSSTVFLFIFLPVVYVLYLLTPSHKLRNMLLIAASIVFYAYGELIAVGLMVISVIFNYFFGLYIAKNTSKKKAALIISVIFNLSLLVFFKYSGFLVETFNAVSGLAIPVPDVGLPIGISFFTFHAMSYTIDVYKDNSMVQKKFSSLLLYISFFPQLVAGPIIKYYDIAEQIDKRTITLEATANGIRRFICGLSKKLLIADTLAIVADLVYSLDKNSLSMPVAWLGAAAYMLQIYFDFSGYSDMALGLAKMFGFTFKENFNYPYISLSMRDFWRRWHISVSSWFKEYLYFPLGGNRKGEFRASINRIIVFFFTGLWHGANMTFIVWGLFHGLFLLLETYNIIPIEKIKWKPIKHIYTLIVVMISFVIFRADTLSQAGLMLQQMFTGFSVSPSSFRIFAEQLNPLFITVFVFAIILSAPVSKKLDEKLQSKSQVIFKNSCSYAGTLALLLLCICSLSSATFSPFIYFRF